MANPFHRLLSLISGPARDEDLADDTAGRLRFLAGVLGMDRPIRLVDIGANPVGGAVYDLLQAAGLCHVWGFEPDPRSFQILQDAGPSNMTIFPVAVGDGTRQSFYCCNAPVFSSLFCASADEVAYLGRFHDGLTVVSRQEVQTSRLDDLADLPPPDFLKMDAQGAELQVLKNGRDKLKDAVCVVVELRFLRLYEGEPLMGEVDQELRAQGFFLHKFISPKSVPLHNSQDDRLRLGDMRSQLVDGDAVYLRGLTTPDSLTDEQLKFLALLSDSVFQSHDMTLRCLDVLAARTAIADDCAARYVAHLPKHMIRPDRDTNAEPRG